MTRGDTGSDRIEGARPLDALTSADVHALGDEVHDLSALASAGVPIARGFVVPLGADPEALAPLLGASLRTPDSDETAPQPALSLRPWFRTLALSHRAEARWPAVEDVRDPASVVGAIRDLHAQLEAPSLRAVLSQSPGSLWLRAVHTDEGPAGRACSVDPDDGDAGCVAVWLPERAPWRLDRKTMRPLEEGRGPLPRAVLERAADLADRAQLALGRPVEVDWVLRDGRPAVARVRPVNVNWRFTDEPFRKVALLWHDEGPIAPLSVDTLDKALREETDAVDVPRVRRLFARAFRRIEEGRGRDRELRHSFAAASTRMARALSDVARPIAAAREFEKALGPRLSAFDADALTRLEDAELARALRERQGVVIEAYALLDRARVATGTVFGALEATLGTVPRECVHGLAAIRRTKARRRLDERLARAASQLGKLPTVVDPVPAHLRRTFAELRREMADRRPLGLDLRPVPYGASDAALVQGMRAARDGRAERAEREQRQAIRRLMATARARPLGRGRAALARTLTMTVERLADAKGRIAEGLAEANLRLRDVAIEVGRRLTDRGVLDSPEDALYLYVGEIQDALSGEPGAYTARARLRREEDDRWHGFEPPTHLTARPRPRRPTW